jgi:hypothetical protein
LVTLLIEKEIPLKDIETRSRDKNVVIINFHYEGEHSYVQREHENEKKVQWDDGNEDDGTIITTTRVMKERENLGVVDATMKVAKEKEEGLKGAIVFVNH